VGARFHRSLLRHAIDSDQAIAWAIAKDPFEVIEQRPVHVAAHIDAIIQAALDAGDRLLDVSHAARVIECVDAILRNVHRLAGRLRGEPDGMLERLGIKFFTRMRQLDAGCGTDKSMTVQA
jgi:hypothetical protein